MASNNLQPFADSSASPVFDGELLAPHRRTQADSLRQWRPTLTGVDNDQAAARRFLQEYISSPHTYRGYETEITRLFYWAASIGKTVSQLNRTDYDCYAAFLANPQPHEVWCGPRKPRHDPNWRPFVKGLSPRSIRHALTIIQSMLAYWVQDGYLIGNPLALKRLKTVQGEPTAARDDEPTAGDFERFFDPRLRNAIEATLAELPRDTPRQTAKAMQISWIYHLLAGTGCRISEVAAAVHGDCVEFDEGWWLRVIGKGRKRRMIPLSASLLTMLKAYRQFHGLAPLPTPDDTTPLLPPLYLSDRRGAARQGILPRRAHTLLKILFEHAAQRLEMDSPAGATRLRQGSAHWFRHTFVTRLVNNNTPVRSIMDTTGHADERTFRKYNQRLREERFHDITQVFNKDD